MAHENEIYRCLRSGDACRFVGRKREYLDHLFENIGIFLEDQKDAVADLEEVGIFRDQLEPLIQDQHIELYLDPHQVERFRWLPNGEILYKKIIRRHRLAERLLVDILQVPLGTEERTEGPACLLDHSLSDEVADSICTLLGHPTTCPHNHPIPPGECCVRVEYAVKPLWIPLSRVKVGKEYVVHTILDEEAAEKLIRLGISIGSKLWIRQTLPTVVLDCEQTTVACDQDIAQYVLVRDVHR
ncbi:MAG: metal-dependent transcriptional regulator [bacterium]|nr:metal-dependent transcriptional regulator [bacterium]